MFITLRKVQISLNLVPRIPEIDFAGLRFLHYFSKYQTKDGGQY
jgi:hypothetical protein